jgi:hypothetical protein
MANNIVALPNFNEVKQYVGGQYGINILCCQCVICSKYSGYGKCIHCNTGLIFTHFITEYIDCHDCNGRTILKNHDDNYTYIECMECSRFRYAGLKGIYICSTCILNLRGMPCQKNFRDDDGIVKICQGLDFVCKYV